VERGEGGFGPGVLRGETGVLVDLVLETDSGPEVKTVVVNSEVEFITVEGLTDSVSVALAADDVDEADSVV